MRRHPLEDQRWRRGTIVTLFMLLGVACVTAGVFGSRVLAPAVTERDVNREIGEHVGDAFTEACERNQQYRIQVNDQARLGDESRRLQVEANEALIEVLNAIDTSTTGSAFNAAVARLNRTLDRVNASLNELRANATPTLPLPHCGDYQQVVRDVLDRTSG